MKNTKKYILNKNNKKFFCKEAIEYDHNLINAFSSEIEVYNLVKNDHIMPSILEFSLNPERSFILYEFIESYKWSELLKLDFTNKVILMVKILKKIKVLHDNAIIHCDIKLSNILLSKEQVYIVDFETCQINGECCGLGGGTIEYSAPEYDKNRVANEKTDIYSLGVVLYYLIEGKHPFDGSQEEIMLKKINNKYIKTQNIKINVILNKTINSNPNDRYNNVQSFIDDLKSLISDNVVN